LFKADSKLGTHNQEVGEADVNGLGGVEVSDLLVGESDLESFNVRDELLGLAAPENGEDEGCLVHDVCDSDYRER
jgi:hypothetical protein